MGKLGKGLVAVVALAAAAWVGGWFYVKGKIPQALAQQTAALKAQGLEVTHGPVTVTGFPFKHNARVESVTVVGKQEAAGQPLSITAQIPWVEGSWAMFSPSKGQLTGVAETSQVNLTLGAAKLAGPLVLRNLRGSISGGDVVDYDLAADGIDLSLKAAADAEASTPRLNAASTQSGAATLKGSAGAGKASFENSFVNLVSRAESLIPNPEPGQTNLVTASMRSEWPSLAMKGQRDGQNRSGEALLPPELKITLSTEGKPEVTIPLRSTNSRMTFAESPTRYDVAWTGDSMGYAVTQVEGPLTMVTDTASGKFDVKGYLDKSTIEQFTPARLEAGQAPDFAKVGFRFDYKSADSTATVKATNDPSVEPAPFSGMPPLPSFDLKVDTGPSEGVIALENGAFNLTGVSAQNKFAFSGPADVSGEIANLTAKIQGPLTPGEQPKPFAFEYDFDKVTLNEGAWDMIDPTGALDRNLNRLRVAFSGDLLINAPLGDQEAAVNAMMEGKQPIAPNALKIDDVTIDALGLLAKATGQAQFDPANPNAPPSGSADVSLKGWQEFLNSLVNAGYAPPDALAMAEGMIGMLGRDGPDGAKTFNIQVSQSGDLTVNDNPMGPIPGFAPADPADQLFPEDGGSPFEQFEEEPPMDQDGFPFDGEGPAVEEQELAPLTAPETEPAPAEEEAAPAPETEPETETEAVPAPVLVDPAQDTPLQTEQEAAPVEEGTLERIETEARQGAHEADQRLQEGVDSLNEHLHQGGQEIREGVEGLGERIEGGAEHLRQEGGQLLEGAGERLNEAGQQIREGAEGLGERIEGGAEHLRQEGGQLLEGAGERLNEAGQQIREGAEGLGERIEGGAEHLEQEIQRGLDNLRTPAVPATPAAPATPAPAQ